MSDRFRFRAWLKDRKKYDYDIEDCFEDWVFENFGQYENNIHENADLLGDNTDEI